MEKYKKIEQFRKKVLTATTIASLGLIATNANLVKADTQQVTAESNSITEIDSQECQQSTSDSNQSTLRQTITNETSSLLRNTYTGQPVTVRYISFETGQDIAPSVTMNGDLGASYFCNEKWVRNHRLKEVRGNRTGAYSNSPQTVTFVYTSQGAPVTIRNHDEDGNEIIPDQTKTGSIGSAWTIVPISREPYFTYVRFETTGPVNPGSLFPAGNYGSYPTAVTFIYHRNPVSPVTPTEPVSRTSTVIVHYQDENGNQIATSEVLTGKVGDGYVSSTKEISGYTLKVRPDNATGFFTEAQQVVIYIYSANVEEPDDSKQPSTNHQKPVVTPANKHQSRNSEVRPISKDPNRKKQLPQTGADEQTNYSMLALGITVSLLSSFVGYIFTRRKREN